MSEHPADQLLEAEGMLERCALCGRKVIRDAAQRVYVTDIPEGSRKTKGYAGTQARYLCGPCIGSVLHEVASEAGYRWMVQENDIRLQAGTYFDDLDDQADLNAQPDRGPEPDPVFGPCLVKP
jgi:hypothetical protein